MTIRYIRLLKFDSSIVDDRSIKVVIVLTITNDLGDSSHPEPLDLSLGLSWTGHEFRQTVRWTGSQTVQKYHFDMKAGQKKVSRDGWLDLRIAAEKTLEEEPVLAEFLTTFLDAKTCIVGLEAIKSISGPFDDRVITREFKLSGTKDTFILFEEQGDSICAHIWDAGLITCALLSESQRKEKGQSKLVRALRETLSRGGKVVELGTGIGMVGRCADLVFADDDLQITLTDLPSAGPLITRNISTTPSSSSSSQSRKRQKVDGKRISFEALDWTLPIPEPLAFPLDTILMTDVTYNETYHDALLDTLDALSKAPDCRILFASKYRHVSERPFIDALRERFNLLAGAVYDGSTFRESTSVEPSIGDVEGFLFSLV